MAFCSQPKAFASDLGDDQSRYLEDQGRDVDSEVHHRENSKTKICQSRYLIQENMMFIKNKTMCEGRMGRTE